MKDDNINVEQNEELQVCICRGEGSTDNSTDPPRLVLRRLNTEINCPVHGHE